MFDYVTAAHNARPNKLIDSSGLSWSNGSVPDQIKVFSGDFQVKYEVQKQGIIPIYHWLCITYTVLCYFIWNDDPMFFFPVYFSVTLMNHSPLLQTTEHRPSLCFRSGTCHQLPLVDSVRTAAGPIPDEDDDRGRLGHGSDHAAHTDNTQEGEEGLLTAWTGTLSWQSHCIFAGAGYTRTAGQVLTRKQETRAKWPLWTRYVSAQYLLWAPSSGLLAVMIHIVSVGCNVTTHRLGAASEARWEVGHSIRTTHGAHRRCVTVTVTNARWLRLLPGLQRPMREVKVQVRGHTAWIVCVQFTSSKNHHKDDFCFCIIFVSLSIYSRSSLLLVAVGNRNSGNRSSVTAQEEKTDVAGGGHQVDQHGHADSAQSRQVQLLNQEPPEEDTQAGTGDGGHTWGEKQKQNEMGAA